MCQAPVDFWRWRVKGWKRKKRRKGGKKESELREREERKEKSKSLSPTFPLSLQINRTTLSPTTLTVDLDLHVLDRNTRVRHHQRPVLGAQVGDPAVLDLAVADVARHGEPLDVPPAVAVDVLVDRALVALRALVVDDAHRPLRGRQRGDADATTDPAVHDAGAAALAAVELVVVHRDRDHGSGRPGGGRHGVGEVLVEGAGALGVLEFWVVVVVEWRKKKKKKKEKKGGERGGVSFGVEVEKKVRAFEGKRFFKESERESSEEKIEMWLFFLILLFSSSFSLSLSPTPLTWSGSWP